MAGEFDAVASAINPDSTSTDVTNPSVDPLDEELEARGYPYTDDPRYTAPEGEGDQPADASTGESVPEGEAQPEGEKPAEPTDEEKQIEAEIKRVAAENPTGLVKHLRTTISGALRGKAEATARAEELEQELESERGVAFRPTAPASEFKANEFMGDIAEKQPAYYEPIVKDVLKTHLDPARMQSDPEYVAPVLPVLTEIFRDKWMPDFIQKTYGVDLQTFSRVVDAAMNGQLPTPNAQPPATGARAQALIEQYQLTPEAHPELIAALQANETTARQIATMQSQIEDLRGAQGNGAKQQQEAAAAERVQQFDQIVTQDRQSLLDASLRALPRGKDGQILPQFADLPQQIADLVELELNRDTNYTAARGHASEWFKQPGNVESAKKLAGGDLKKIHGHHQTTVQKVAERVLRPYADLIRAQSKVEQNARAQVQVKGGQSPDHVPAPVQQPKPNTRPLTLAERAMQIHANKHAVT